MVRLLDKTNFGLFAIANVLMTIGRVVADFGISEVVIQSRNLEKRAYSSLYWFVVVLSIFIFGMLAVLAPIIAMLYGQPELSQVIFWTATGVPIAAIGFQFIAILQKEMNFRATSIVMTGSFLVFVPVAVTLAIMGYGVYALVFGVIARLIAQTAIGIFFTKKEDFPSFQFSFADVRSVSQYGLFQTGEELLQWVVLYLDVLIIGYFLGPALTGVYDVFKGLLGKVNSFLTPFVSGMGMPVFAEFQTDMKTSGEIYKKIISYLGAIMIPGFVLSAGLAEPIVNLFFGTDWSEVIDVFRFLCLGFIGVTLMRPIGSLSAGIGKPEYGFYWNIFQVSLLGIGTYFAVSFGLVGTAFFYAAANLIFFVAATRFVIKPLLSISEKSQLRGLFFPILASVGVGVTTWICGVFIQNDILKIVVNTALALLICSVIYSRFTPQFIDEMKSVLKK